MKHDWKQVIYRPGYKKQECKKCGAMRECINIYVKYQDKWTPATLNDKRQPLCIVGRE